MIGDRGCAGDSAKDEGDRKRAEGQEREPEQEMSRVETEIGLGYRRVVCTLPLDPTGRAAAAS